MPIEDTPLSEPTFAEKVHRITGAAPADPDSFRRAEKPVANLPNTLKGIGRAARNAAQSDDAAAQTAPARAGGWPLGAVVSLSALVLVIGGGLGWGLSQLWPSPPPKAAKDVAAPPPASAPEAYAAAAPDAPAAVASAAAPTNETGLADPTGLSEQTPQLVQGDSPFYESQKLAAQAQLRELMSDPHGLIFRDVEMVIAGSGSLQSVNFCGDVNSVNPKGDYIGFQRFISSADQAQIEQFMTPGDFSLAWRARCSGPHGPKIWS
jgi:hypothetical protein